MLGATCAIVALFLIAGFSCSPRATASVERGAYNNQTAAQLRHQLVTARTAALSCQEERLRKRRPHDHAEHSRSLPYLKATRDAWRSRLSACRKALAKDERRWKRDPVGYAKQIARYLLARKGWGSQFWALDYIITQESGWEVCKVNGGAVDCAYDGPRAYGLPQALPGRKMGSYGADWRTNPRTQLRWLIFSYIPSSGNFHDPVSAYRFWIANHWY